MNTIKGKVVVVLSALLLVEGAFAVGSSFHLVANSTAAAPSLYSQDTVTSIYNNAIPRL